MSKLSLNVLNVGATAFQPSAVGRPQTSPVHKPETQLASRGLNVPGKNVVVARRAAGLHRLEHEIVGPVDFTTLYLLLARPARTVTVFSFSAWIFAMT